jgi:hypothetical protein
MLNAMILACAIDVNGNEICTVFTSGYVATTIEECVEDLNFGSKFVTESGWEIRAFECYDWTKKKGTAL